MTPRLIAIRGPFEGRIFEIQEHRFVIGRQADCDLQINHIEVSRRHCEIVRDQGRRFMLRDLGSRHGTLVNERPTTETVLSHSDLVTLGTNAFLFMLDDSVAERDGASETGSMPAPGHSLERKVTESLHLNPTWVDAALPVQARLARELHTLLRVSTDLQRQRKIPPLAAKLLDAIFDAIPIAERGSVLLLETGLDRPVSVACRGSDMAELESTVLDRVFQQGIAVCRPRADGDPDPKIAEQGADNVSSLAAPLGDVDGEPIGLIYLDCAVDDFNEHHLELLIAIAGVASLAIQNVFHLRWLESENRRLRDEDAARHDMIGDSPAMKRVFDLVSRVARADSTVLIHGESGTGKELVARAIHHSSPRKDGPLIAVNCATLSDNLLESELFGHEKGAFTGAQERKIGKIEAANRGTLFLDEVAEIPLGLQAKLLRALQEREIERVGGLRPIAVDVRVVAASHRDLAQAVKDGEFREDLFFRLKVITCDLPALRERREDIPLLARHLARRHGKKLGFAEVGIAPEARRCLLAYDWPGNVRELGNVIERAVVLGDGNVVRREDLPDEVAVAAGRDLPARSDDLPSGSTDFQGTLVAFKKQLIFDAWHAAGEDYARTAKHLGIHLNSLHRMVKNLGIKSDLGR